MDLVQRVDSFLQNTNDAIEKLEFAQRTQTYTQIAIAFILLLVLIVLIVR